MFSQAKAKDMDWGAIDTLPEIPGMALYKDGHAGYYIGNGEAVEWRGFNYWLLFHGLWIVELLIYIKCIKIGIIP